MITDEQLAEWERLAGAATAEPWDLWDPDHVTVVTAKGYFVATTSDTRPVPAQKADAAFIAASREAVPALVAALREARADLTALRAVLIGVAHGVGFDAMADAERAAARRLLAVIGGES